MYTTRLREWKDDLEAELRRDVTWHEISEGTGLAYSTLQKHQSHEFVRPDYGAAKRISEWFNKMSRASRKWTALDYYVEQTEEGQLEAVAAI